jgi:hypothetical protein
MNLLFTYIDDGAENDLLVLVPHWGATRDCICRYAKGVWDIREGRV